MDQTRDWAVLLLVQRICHAAGILEFQRAWDTLSPYRIVDFVDEVKVVSRDPHRIPCDHIPQTLHIDLEPLTDLLRSSNKLRARFLPIFNQVRTVVLEFDGNLLGHMLFQRISVASSIKLLERAPVIRGSYH